MCQVRIIPFEQQTNSFSLKIGKGIIFSNRRKNQFKRLLELFLVQYAQIKSVFTFQLTKTLVFTTLKNAKSAATCEYSF